MYESLPDPTNSISRALRRERSICNRTASSSDPSSRYTASDRFYNFVGIFWDSKRLDPIASDRWAVCALNVLVDGGRDRDPRGLHIFTPN